MESSNQSARDGSISQASLAREGPDLESKGKIIYSFHGNKNALGTGLSLIRLLKLEGKSIFAQWVGVGYNGYERASRDDYDPIFDAY